MATRPKSNGPGRVPVADCPCMDTAPGLDLDSPPFDLLDQAARKRLQGSVDFGFFPAGTRLIEQNRASEHAFVVLKGRVDACDERDGKTQRFADYGPGDVFGAFAVIMGRARHTYVSAEDTLCHLIPAGLFQKLIAENPRFAAFFNEGLSVKRKLLAEQQGGSELARLMLTRVLDAQLAPAVEVPAGTSIIDAAARLKHDKVDCLVVAADSAQPRGIVTRTDLLEAVALSGLGLETPVGNLASRPLVSVRSEEVLFQALVTMTEKHIERVVVDDGERILGTLGMAEVLAHYASNSHLISLRLARAESLEDIAEAASRMTALVRTLHAQGARMSYLMEMVSALNSRIMGQIFQTLVPAEHRDKVCLLVMGSEGRREQILKTDQDNALVLADDLDWPGLGEAMDRFSAALGRVGYPPCPGKVMVNNAYWRMDQTQWRKRIESWRRDAGGQTVLDLSIALDARPIAGNSDLFDPIKDAMMGLGEDHVLMRFMAEGALGFGTPLTLFGKVRTDDGRTDLKKGGVFPLVHGVRTLALAHGIRRNSTFDRLAALGQADVLSKELARDVTQALAVFQRLRLAQQLVDDEAGRTPGNTVDVRGMRKLDRELLRDALRVVNAFKDRLRERFKLGG